LYRKYLPWYVDENHDAVCIKNTALKRLPGHEIVLLNWNVHKNNHHYKWLQDFKDMLSAYQPDIITFQEYQTMSARSIIDKHEEYAYGFFPNIAYKHHMFGLLTACKSDLHQFSSLFTCDVEPLIKTPKVSFITEYMLESGERLMLINVHMINFVKIRKFRAQVKQIEDICQGHVGPLILTGDFNTWSKKRMRLIEHLCEHVGLEAVRFEKKDHQKALMAQPLDHIYYRGFVQEEAFILKEIETSDHKPMLVKLVASKS